MNLSSFLMFSIGFCCIPTLILIFSSIFDCFVTLFTIFFCFSGVFINLGVFFSQKELQSGMLAFAIASFQAQFAHSVQ